MAGNVAEWVADVYADGYYATAPERNPPGPLMGTSRVRRGGSYLDGPAGLSALVRRSAPETQVAPENGFRCARGAR